ncbi:MAG: phosphate ABC transporter substrate-binding protein PstS [Deltaproteobacteria bacterium]|nr:phosphate ABC transporter substrate-binding protein PstS [Deltaproteobacteria bacterium]MBI3386716.1 phosphate ABC transporter substrate-binding protein PstS [Deltaproteobacteria bacterium]
MRTCIWRSALVTICLGALAGSAHAQLQLNGAGATFPYPMYSKWFNLYTQVDPSVRFNYQSIGSGGGIKQITEQTVDFGATDGPMSDEQLRAAPGPILHFPTVMGAAVLTYNVEGLGSGLKLTPNVIAGIFLGKITKWNDAAIAAPNPGANLPPRDIIVVHRSDGSGTSYIFTDYLSKISSEWNNKVGKATSVNWPVGLGGKGNEGVTGLVKQTPFSIGYVELIYATSNELPYADVQNAAGALVTPSLESVTAAAAALAQNMPDDFRVSITNAPGTDAYPISSLTWLLVYEKQKDTEKGKKLVQFLTWMIHDGQLHAPALHYAPLPKEVVAKEEQAIHRVTAADGKPLQ